MHLICYSILEDTPKIVPAPVERGWMEETGDGFAYRCLPLNIANAHGWLLLNTVPFAATWSGTPDLASLSIEPLESRPGLLASSHFGHGVLTFNVNALFRTAPGYDLAVAGPFNQPKDAIQPLTGMVETDWSPFTFTMNWKFTRRLTPVIFERDEPFCMIFPIRRADLERTEPVVMPIEQDPEVFAAYTDWSKSRRDFNENLRVPGSPAQAEKWQKDYFRGAPAFGTAPADHRTKLRVKPFLPPRRAP